MAGSVLFDTPGPRAHRRYALTAALTVVGIVVVLAAIVWRLWTKNQFDYDLWEPFVTPRFMKMLGIAALQTLGIAAFAIAGALVFGVFFGFGKLIDNPIVKWVSWTVVEFFRAVPLLMLIIFIWIIWGAPLDNIWPLVFGLVLYNGAILAEVFRAGMNAVPRGQVEAAYALGLRKGRVMRIIQFPQAAKMMLPTIISQCIVALKDTSLGYVILAPGLTFAGREIWRTFNNRLATAIVLLIIYVAMNLILERLGVWVERKTSSGHKIEVVGGVVTITAIEDNHETEATETRTPTVS